MNKIGIHTHTKKKPKYKMPFRETKKQNKYVVNNDVARHTNIFKFLDLIFFFIFFFLMNRLHNFCTIYSALVFLVEIKSENKKRNEKLPCCRFNFLLSFYFFKSICQCQCKTVLLFFKFKIILVLRGENLEYVWQCSRRMRYRYSREMQDSYTR